MPIAALLRIEEIREAVELQAGQHVRGKVAIDLSAADTTDQVRPRMADTGDDVS